MRVILPGTPAGTMNIRGLAPGYQQASIGMSVRQSGDGFEDIRGASHIREGIVNNAIANSKSAVVMGTGEISGGVPWALPIALAFRLHEFLLSAEGHVGVCIGEWPNVAAPATNARTDVTFPRLQLIIERDGAGNQAAFLVTADGAARDEVQITIPLINDWIVLLWRTTPARVFEFYRNGALVRSMNIALPSLTQAGQFLASWAVWKVLADPTRNHIRCYAIGVNPALDAAGV